MPKCNVNDITQEFWRAEVSWRPQGRTCACGTSWTAPVPDCPECDAVNVPITSGHVQVASVNQHSKFQFEPTLLDYGPNGEEKWSEPEPFDGWRITLDDTGIDRMIAALTQARRQAFGGECGQKPCDHAPDGGNHPLNPQ